MYSIGTIKALVAVGSTVLGAGAVAVTIAIQQNPMLFTNPAPAIIEAPYVPREIPALPPPVAAVIIPEVEISAAPQTFETKAALRRVTRALEAPPPAAAAPEVTDPSEDRVIPAPCNDGEYRKIDERQGVRLMCPGSF